MEISAQELVSFKGIQPQTAVLMMVTFFAVQELDSNAKIVITSANRKGGRKSIHPFGLAFDFKVEWSNLSFDKELNEILIESFGAQFDFVFHKDSDGNGWHHHCEWDERV